MSSQTSRLGPWDATIPHDLRYGSISQGNGPPSPPSPPTIIADYIWASSGGAYYPGAPAATTTVTTGQFVILVTNTRVLGGPATAGVPTLTGTAVLTAPAVVYASARYDTLGVSDGAAGVWSATVTSGGTLTIGNGGAQDIVCVGIILSGGSVSQQSRNTADDTPIAATTLGLAPTNPVLMICSYGGIAVSTATAEPGWTEAEHVGNATTYNKYVMSWEGSDQGVSFDLGASATSSGGRDIILLEIA